MGQISDFLDMGGYAAYVWPAYALAALVLVALLVSSLRSLRAGQRELKRLEAKMPSRRHRDRALGGDGSAPSRETAS